MYNPQNKRYLPRTSWESVANWYGDLVGKDGQYFHQNIIIPGVLKHLELNPSSSLLDLACGQGVLQRKVPKECKYLGLDISESLIRQASKFNKNLKHRFEVKDISQKFELKEKFTHAVIILALQNIENIVQTIKNISNSLENQGKIIIVINHPYFRIPRQTSWGIDERNNLEYRKVNLYKSEIKIPIDHTPGSQFGKKITWSFHRTLETYSKLLFENNFLIEVIEEWTSDKKSEGKNAKRENRARSEIPMFMMIKAKKSSRNSK